MGAGIGLLFGTYDPLLVPEDAPVKVKVKEYLKMSARNMHGLARNFGLVGLIYTWSECLIEKVSCTYPTEILASHISPVPWTHRFVQFSFCGLLHRRLSRLQR
jgi:hypothetical protein